MVFARFVQYDKIKYFAAFCGVFMFCHQLSANFSKMCLKNTRTATEDGMC